ncbi:MAG: VanZ family protein [Proteobacteria bacterium]|nr:VanZ family protein [Pseudomonadota bacterium]
MIPKAFSNDKVLHFGGYALLGALFLRALITYPIRKKRTLILLSILCASLYGVSDEFHQSFVPSRNADVYDVLADTVGSVLGVAAYYLLNRFSGLQKR